MKRCKKLEEIKEKIKLEFPGIELYQDKSIIYFKFNDSIWVYAVIKTWRLYLLCISYNYPGLTGKQYLMITNTKEIREYINKIEKYNINRDEVF